MLLGEVLWMASVLGPPLARILLLTKLREGRDDGELARQLGPHFVANTENGFEVLLPRDCENVTWTRDTSEEGADALRAAAMLRL